MGFLSALVSKAAMIPTHHAIFKRHEQRRQTMNKTEGISILAFVFAASLCCAQPPVSNTNSNNATAGVAQKKPPANSFDIPPSLVFRMIEAYQKALQKALSGTNTCDVLALKRDGQTNCSEITERPYGEMKFCDDRLPEEARKAIWPFEFDAFEKTLEQQTVRDAEGCFRRKGSVEKNGGAVDHNGLFAVNPTFRWVNYEIEHWAIQQLDSKFKRMDKKAFCKMWDVEKMPDGIWAWVLDNAKGEYFVIQRNKGAWASRKYMYLRWDGKEEPVCWASFPSFPNRREGVTISMCDCSIASLHNLVVLYWNHRANASNIDLKWMKGGLELAKKFGIPTAEANLKVLLDHIPEAADK